MGQWQVRNPDFESAARRGFDRQRVMTTFGARVARVEPGLCEIELPFREDLTQQHGFLHAGVVATVLDTACGFAAFTLMPPGASVLSVEYKIQLLRPARGERFLAIGRVVRPGASVTATQGEALALDGDTRTPVALMTATMITLNRDGLEG